MEPVVQAVLILRNKIVKTTRICKSRGVQFLNTVYSYGPLIRNNIIKLEK